jgi:hypothetical protein
MKKIYHRLRRWSMQANSWVVKATLLRLSRSNKRLIDLPMESLSLEKTAQQLNFY